MKRLLVIADDITGAAEMAGVALGFGCRVRFTTSVERLTEKTAAPAERESNAPAAAKAEELSDAGTRISAATKTVAPDATGAAAPDAAAEVCILATDTRSMPRREAVAASAAIAARLQGLIGAGAADGVRLFKKTDSALRGHLAAELRELLRAGFDRALLLPANPSKGRCIVGGRYLIDGVPIDRTLFRSDPEFPAETAEVLQLLGGGADLHYVTPASERLERGISIGETADEAAFAAYMARFAAEPLLLAGAADAFRALLAAEGLRERSLPPFAGLGGRRTLIVLGSTVRHDLTAEPLLLRRRTAVVPMPDALFAGGAAECWIGAARKALAEGADLLLLHIPQPVQVDGARARHLRAATARTAAALAAEGGFDELVIEGGATAFATLEALGWRDFTVTERIASGVVRLRCTASGVGLIFKPGSYDWGPAFR